MGLTADSGGVSPGQPGCHLPARLEAALAGAPIHVLEAWSKAWTAALQYDLGRLCRALTSLAPALPCAGAVQVHAPPTAPRILLYSHDSYGLGHLRRTLTLAEALVGALPLPQVLVVTGSPLATFFGCPDGVGLIKLPSVTKDASGAYAPRSMSIGLEDVLRLRRRLFLEAFRVFAPQLVLIDHQVVGLHGEALPVLREAKDRGIKTILGIRDVIDTPAVVAREWSTPERRWALSEGYDRLCVYGSPEVFDAHAEYPIPPELGERAQMIGYVAAPRRTIVPRALPSLRPQLAVTMGGGEDAASRVEMVLDALELGPADWETTLVPGPLMPEDAFRSLRRRARALDGVRVHRSYGDVPSLFATSDAVVAMAGYNTAVEILQSGKPAVFLPRTHPRREQEIRAERFAQLGLATSLPAPTPEALRDAIGRALEQRVERGRLPDLDGRARLCEVVADLLGLSVPAAAPLRKRSAAS